MADEKSKTEKKDNGAKQVEASMFSVHPAADLFPMMPEDELKEMAKSITAYGLREKIGVIPNENGEGFVVLDGRNRLAALKLVGVTDAQIEENFMVPLDLERFRCTAEEYVLMANIERRNLTAAQRRALAGKLAVMLSEKQKDAPKEEQTDTLTEAAALAGVSRRTAATAKRTVLEEAGKVKPKAPAKQPGAAMASKQIIAQLQKIADAVTKSGHNFALDSLNEIAQSCTNIARVAHNRVELVAKRNAEKMAAMAEGAQKAAETVQAAAEEEVGVVVEEPKDEDFEAIEAEATEDSSLDLDISEDDEPEEDDAA